MHLLESYSDEWRVPGRAAKAMHATFQRQTVHGNAHGSMAALLDSVIRFCLYTRRVLRGSLFVYQLKYRLLLASNMPCNQWFESFLKLLLSLKCSHLSSLLISAASEWVREILNCPFSLAECNIALLCAWVMACYEWRNCPNKARNPGSPHQAVITLSSSFSTMRHVHCCTCNSDPGGI